MAGFAAELAEDDHTIYRRYGRGRTVVPDHGFQIVQIYAQPEKLGIAASPSQNIDETFLIEPRAISCVKPSFRLIATARGGSALSA